MLRILSAAQRAAMGPCAARWIKIGLSTAPVDRARAKAAIELAYECAGLKAPAQFVWCQSPLAVWLASSMGPNQAVTPEIWKGVKNSAHASIKREVHDSVWNQAHDAVWDNVYSVYRTAGSAVYHEICSHDRTSIQDSILAGVSDSLWEAGLGGCWDLGHFIPQDSDAPCAGSHDASWLSFYSFFREECGMETETSKLTGLLAVAEECGWWVPCRDRVFVSPRPSAIGTNSVVYEDGSVYPL